VRFEHNGERVGDAGVRIGTWNLQQGVPPSSRSASQRGFLEAQQTDLWLLTEVHARVHVHGADTVLSPPRTVKPSQRWSGISTCHPIEALPSPHEGLALARVHLDERSLLVGCSVMPWRGARTSWPGDATASFDERFSLALAIHLDAVQHARRSGEGVVWGGDFNQSLDGTETVGSRKSRSLLLDGFESLGLGAATARLEHLNPKIFSIDHIAVPTPWSVLQSQALRPVDAAGKRLSDHAAYVVEARGTGN